MTMTNYISSNIDMEKWRKSATMKNEWQSESWSRKVPIEGKTDENGWFMKNEGKRWELLRTMIKVEKLMKTDEKRLTLLTMIGE